MAAKIMAAALRASLKIWHRNIIIERKAGMAAAASMAKISAAWRHQNERNANNGGISESSETQRRNISIIMAKASAGGGEEYRASRGNMKISSMKAAKMKMAKMK
jgi:hypothetical protein